SSPSRSSRPLSLLTDPATADIYTPSLHDALPILPNGSGTRVSGLPRCCASMSWLGRLVGTLRKPSMSSLKAIRRAGRSPAVSCRSEEHTSELQSRENLVCRLLLEKKKGADVRARP